jgi:hypothetical protein
VTDLALFDLEPFEAPEWTRERIDPWGAARVHRHRDGYVVEHCGHPTALWPWIVWDPDRRPVERPAWAMGRGALNWTKAREAKAHVELLAAERRTR